MHYIVIVSAFIASFLRQIRKKAALEQASGASTVRRCGPFRTVIREPGSYAFPLVDLTEYDVYTAPTAVPLSFAYTAL